MGNLKILNDADFEAATESGVALIDFWAEWCGPCKMMIPVLEEIADELVGKALVAKVNVGEANNVAANFGVKMIPAFFVLKNGKVVDQLVGVQDKDALLEAVKNAM